MLRIILWRALYHFFCFLKTAGISGPSRFYFAYGANLDPEVLKERNITPKSQMDYLLENFRLLFNHEIPFKDAGMASVTPAAGDRVPGRVYEIDWIDALRLDCKEGHLVFNRYSKYWFKLPNGKSCFCYRSNRPKAGLFPIRDYLQEIVNGYRLLSVADARFTQTLEQAPTIDGFQPKDPPHFLVHNYERFGRPLRPLLIGYDKKCVKLYASLISKPSIFEKSSG